MSSIISIRSTIQTGHRAVAFEESCYLLSVFSQGPDQRGSSMAVLGTDFRPTV